MKWPGKKYKTIYADPPWPERGGGNNHPTVKPLALIKYLITLVTRPCGVSLDTFVGSGTHPWACIEARFYKDFKRREGIIPENP